jgi:Anticodon binding domain of methionyl tRNA ligase
MQRGRAADAGWHLTIQVPVVAGAYERMAFHEAAHAAVAISSRGNLFLQETAPWTAFKKVRALYKPPRSQEHRWQAGVFSSLLLGC